MPAVRQRVIAATEVETIHTHAFDDVQQVPWPAEFPGRALRNRFAERWHGRSADLTDEDRAAYGQARAAGDYEVAVIYAGQGAALVQRERPAAEIVRELCEGAEALLRARSASLLD